MTDTEQNPTTTVAEPESTSRFGFLREFIIVIVGALIALAADDYQEASERAERDRQVLVMLKKELDANVQAIRMSDGYHQEMVPKIVNSLRLIEEENRFVMPEGFDNDREIEAVDAAFELAKISGTLSRLSPDTGIILSRTYDELSRFDDRRSQIDLATIQSSFKDGVRYFIMKRVALEIEIEYQKTMLPLYEQAQAAIESELD